MELIAFEKYVSNSSQLMNCYIHPIISFLKYKQLPVEALFYNSCESTDSVLEHTIINERPVFHYDFELGSNKNLIQFGIFPTIKDYTHFENAKEDLFQALGNGLLVLLSLDKYYMHYSQDYLKNPGKHIMILNGYQSVNDEAEYSIIDDLPLISPTFQSYKIKEDYLTSAFEATGGRVYLLEYHQFALKSAKDTLLLARANFLIWREQYSDSFRFYDAAVDVMEESFKLNNHNKDYIFWETKGPWKLCHSFSLIAISRFLFANFLAYIDCDRSIIDLAMNISKKAETLMNVVMKSIMMDRFNRNLFSLLCKEMKELDSRLRAATV